VNRAETESVLATADGRFYVYLLLRPDGTPFYVGKGKERRVFFHESEALGDGRTHKLNIIRQIQKSGGRIGYDILGFYEDEAECHALEIAEILRIGRHDLRTGSLTNLTAGGEGTSGLSEETKQRIDAELHGPNAPGERGVANRFFLEICKDVRSVPVRPLSGFTPKPLERHRRSRAPTRRMAAALAASAIANRILLEPGCTIPRQLSVNGVDLCIENGVGADILRSGMAALIPAPEAEDERFLVSKRGLDLLLLNCNVHILIDAGVLEPQQW
jgi:hypothetical protein